MNGKKVGVVFAGALAIVTSALFLSFMISEPIIENTIESRVPTLLSLGDNNPGDNSGFFYYMVYPHQADPATAYASNLSNATAYEFSDAGNASATGETPYSTTFDIVIKAGVTNEDGYYTANQTRNAGYNWMLLTCADLSISADTNMSEIFISNSTEYAYYHYYLNNSGAGYTIIEGQDFNVTSCKFLVQRIV